MNDTTNNPAPIGTGLHAAPPERIAELTGTPYMAGVPQHRTMGGAFAGPFTPFD